MPALFGLPVVEDLRGTGRWSASRCRMTSPPASASAIRTRFCRRRSRAPTQESAMAEEIGGLAGPRGHLAGGGDQPAPWRLHDLPVDGLWSRSKWLRRRRPKARSPEVLRTAWTPFALIEGRSCEGKSMCWVSACLREGGSSTLSGRWRRLAAGQGPGRRSIGVGPIQVPYPSRNRASPPSMEPWCGEPEPGERRSAMKFFRYGAC